VLNKLAGQPRENHEVIRIKRLEYRIVNVGRIRVVLNEVPGQSGALP
jgi:hypothetical protein